MPNRLIHESSPYLLQHAHNPVDWYPWGEEALTKARDENKLLLISIGYAACHWCHVMERESFEDEDIAALMNTHFVPVKVDREERPDIDKIYMDAVMLMTGRGGWPLNAIALPDGRPIYGGTYFPKDHWREVLLQIAQMHKQSPERSEQYAGNLTQAMQEMDVATPATGHSPISREMLAEAAAIWMEQIDFKWGGRDSSANKFPLPMNNLYLLRAAFLSGDARIEEAVSVTLEKMAYGGIYDHLGGGFARYSVDAYWKVPHFEKMLYDNGQLVSLYAEAWQRTGRERYRRVVYDTMDFVARELTSPEGGFYSSLDADSEGEEGKFYTWGYEEVAGLLGPDTRPFADYYNIHPFGNWEGRSVLFVLEEEDEFAERWKQEPEAFRALLARGRATLLEARTQRVRPGLDDKILSSWNGLMLKGAVDAYRIFGEARFLALALENGRFIRDRLTEGPRLWRSYKEGKATINAFLDDYANVIDGYIALYEVTFDEAWLSQAQIHLDHVLTHFHDEASPLLFYTSDEDPVLIRRKTERQDDVIPSSNAVLAGSLHRLGLLLDRADYRERAEAMLAVMQAELVKNPAWHARWGLLALCYAYPHYEVAITGPQAPAWRLEMERHYYPNRLFAGTVTGSNLPLLQDRMAEVSTIYVCEGHSCRLPVQSVAEAAAQMHQT
ncbi:MAG: thioredoxin domain-containing protein [Bacteroidetes bacterium]|nr:MAG: thioredoxin domain-containing protein [Bacteroidota bacterium]